MTKHKSMKFDFYSSQTPREKRRVFDFVLGAGAATSFPVAFVLWNWWSLFFVGVGVAIITCFVVELDQDRKNRNGGDRHGR